MDIATRIKTELRRTRETATIFRRVNLRHYHDHRRRVLLTVAGLAASVCMLIAISVINATLVRSIQSETRGLAGSAALQVNPAGATPLPAATVATARDTPGVRAAIPVLRVISRIYHNHLSEPLLVFAIPRNLSALFPQGLGGIESRLAAPSFFTSDQITLTSQAASSLGVHANEAVTLQTPSGARSIRVGPILVHNPFASLNGGEFALMALPAGQQLFGHTNEVSSIYVAANTDVQRSTLRDALRHRLGTGVSVGRPGAEGQAYEQTFDTIAAITEKARAIGLLVALFLVINTMTMTIAESREEIALLVTVGAQRRQVFGAFLLEAGALGLIGGIIGVIAGTALAHAVVQRAVASYSVLPITVSGPLTLKLTTILAGLAGGFYTSVIGAAIPATRILRVTPIDALRPQGSYEWAQRRKPASACLTAAGVTAIALSAVVAWQMPIGSSQVVFGGAVILAFGGTLLVIPYVIPAAARLLQRTVRRVLGPSGRLGADAMLRSPARTTITAGGIAVAAGFVIAVGSGIGSFRSATIEAAAQWYQAPLYVNLEGATSYIVNQPLPAAVSRRLASVRGVKALYPMRYGLINAYGHQTLVEAMPIAQAAAHGDYIMGSLGISRHALIRALGRREVVVSRLTARRYHLAPGDVLRLPTTRGLDTIKIGGLYDDLASFDSVLIEHSVYQRVSGDRQADRFAVVTQPDANTAVVKRELQHLLNRLGIAASVFTGSEMSEYLVQSVQGLLSLAQGIEATALLVAALIVLSTMATATFERSQEFGIERTLGMSREQLGRSVIFEGTAMTVVGSLVAVVLGLGLGLLLTLSLEYQLGWPVTFRPTATLTLGVVIATVAIGALAAVYPAWLASRRTIMALLRGA